MSPTPVDPYAPNTVAVYRLFDDRGRLLYVGQTSNPKSRFAAHASAVSWWPEVARWSVEWWPNKTAAVTEEARLIKERTPRYNLVGYQARGRIRSFDDAARAQRATTSGGCIEDVLTVFGQEPKQLRSLVVLARLQNLKPEVYSGWSSRSLRALLLEHGFDVRKSSHSIVRRNEVERAVQRRQRLPVEGVGA